MRPIGQHILIRQDVAPESKIIIPDGGPARPNTGEVIDTGMKVEEITSGDQIMFKDSFMAQQVPGEKDLLVMHEDNVLLIL
ncbi:hypothetical protein VPHD148_0085 [Vibrio phage D148]